MNKQHVSGHIDGALLQILAFFALMLVGFSDATGYSQALPAARGPGSNVTLGGGLSWYQQDYGHNQIGGGTTYIELHPQWRYAVDGEVRILCLHTEQHVTESSYLTGVKIVVSPRPSQITPYLKMLAGAGRITLPFNYAHGTFFTYAPGAGIDYAVNDRISLRLVDLEVQHWTDFPYGALHPYGISTGISLRLNPMRRYPNAVK